MAEQEIKQGFSMKKQHSDLFSLLELNSILKSIINDKALELQAIKKTEKAILELVNDKHIVISSEVKNGNHESVQYTIDAFASPQDRLMDIAYDVFGADDSDKGEKMMSAIENLNLEYDPATKSILVKGLIAPKPISISENTR